MSPNAVVGTAKAEWMRRDASRLWVHGIVATLLPSWHVRGTRMCEASHTRCEIHARACIGIVSSYSVWFFFASSCRSAPVSEDDLSENCYLLFGLMVDRGRMSGASRRLHTPFAGIFPLNTGIRLRRGPVPPTARQAHAAWPRSRLMNRRNLVCRRPAQARDHRHE